MLERKETTGRWKTVYYVDNKGEIARKKCRECLETKEMNDFYPANKGNLGGRKAVCIKCENATFRDYYYKNADYLNEQRIKRRENDPERDLETQRRYFARNRERINKRRTMYPSNINRAAREFGLPAEFTVEDKELLLEIFGGCALTGEKDNLHYDHVIPLTTRVGGTVSWNIMPLKAGLNISKGSKNVFEWFEANKERFELSDERFERAIKYLANEKGVTPEEYRKFVYDAFKNKEE